MTPPIFSQLKENFTALFSSQKTVVPKPSRIQTGLNIPHSTTDAFGRYPETHFLSAVSPSDPLWRGEVARRLTESPGRLLLTDIYQNPIVAHTADRENRAVLAPVDPVQLLLRHRGEVNRLRTAVGSRQLFEEHVLPMLFAWGAVVQSVPRDARGLWSGTDGFFEAGLQFARGALNAVDARVLEPTMAPTKRARWTDRIRVAVVAAGLMSDSERLAGLRLEAGTIESETNAFQPIETHAVGEETGLAFGLRHAGRWFRITRYTPGDRAGRLPTLGLDLLRLVVQSETLLWLGDFERTGGETVLSALKSAVVFGTGKTETERLLADSVARGREWAVNRRAWLAAQREGKTPLLEGFGEVFRLALLSRIERHHWVFNAENSPLIWAEDGLFLLWPEGFVDTIESAGEGSVFREVPDEPDVAAQILLTSGVIEPDPTGEAVWWSDSPEVLPRGGGYSSVMRTADAEGGPMRTAWVKLTNEAKIVNLAKREALRRGEILPHRKPPLMIRPLCRLPDEWEVVPGKFTWRLALPESDSVSASRTTLERAVTRINERVDSPLLGSVRGLFVPEILLDEGFRWDSPDLEGVFVLQRHSPGSAMPGARVSALHRVRFRGTDALRLADLTPERKPDQDGNLLLEGVLIHPLFVRPFEVWADGTEEEKAFPETTGRLEWIEGRDYIGDDKARRQDHSRRARTKTVARRGGRGGIHK